VRGMIEGAVTCTFGRFTIDRLFVMVGHFWFFFWIDKRLAFNVDFGVFYSGLNVERRMSMADSR